MATGEGMEEGTGIGMADGMEDMRADRDLAGEESAGEARMGAVDDDAGGGTGAGDDPDIPTTPPATTCTTLLIMPPLDTGIPGTISAPNICMFSAGTTWGRRGMGISISETQDIRQYWQVKVEIYQFSLNKTIQKKRENN